jgi:hypothetical protein
VAAGWGKGGETDCSADNTRTSHTQELFGRGAVFRGIVPLATPVEEAALAPFARDVRYWFIRGMYARCAYQQRDINQFCPEMDEDSFVHAALGHTLLPPPEARYRQVTITS